MTSLEGVDEGRGFGVSGTSDAGSYGVSGYAGPGNGVFGLSTGGTSIFALKDNPDGYAVLAQSNGSDAIHAVNKGPTSAVYGNGGEWAGYFEGRVRVTRGVRSVGGGSTLDHPLDAANKYLNHSFVESSEMKNVYDGVAVLDTNGEAVVALPEWFEDLNKDFRYQLTPIRDASPTLHIAEKLSANQFKIGGGEPNMEVSWQVTGVRKDRWAEANRIVVEEEKPSEERGYYVHPELYNLSEEHGIDWARNRSISSPHSTFHRS